MRMNFKQPQMDGLVVMGCDSQSEGCGFESHFLDDHVSQ